MQQMKEQSKNLQDQTNEKEIGSLPWKKIQTSDSKEEMIQNLGNRMEKIQETFKKNLPKRNKEQTNNDEQHNKWN